MLDHTPVPVLVLLGFTTLGFAFFAYKAWKAAKLAQEQDINERFEAAYRETYRMEQDLLRGLEECERRCDRDIGLLEVSLRNDITDLAREVANDRRETSVPCLSPKEIALINRNKK